MSQARAYREVMDTGEYARLHAETVGYLAGQRRRRLARDAGNEASIGGGRTAVLLDRLRSLPPGAVTVDLEFGGMLIMHRLGPAPDGLLEGPSGRLYRWEHADGDGAGFSYGRIVPLFPAESYARSCPHC